MEGHGELLGVLTVRLEAANEDALLHLVLVEYGDGAVLVSGEEPLAVVVVLQRDHGRGVAAVAAFHVLSIRAVVDGYLPVHVADDDLPLAVVETARSDVRANDVCVPASPYNNPSIHI